MKNPHTLKNTQALITVLPMDHIINNIYKPGIGRHWFDPSSMRFFSCRLPWGGWQGPGGTFFVSSEKFVGAWGRNSKPRAYTVRKVQEGDIDTVGDFNVYTKSHAETLAQKCAAFGESVVFPKTEEAVA